MIYNYEVKILYKDNVNDPQGLTITESANRIGFDGIKSIRSGKIFMVEIESDSAEKMKTLVDRLCTFVHMSYLIKTRLHSLNF